MADNYTQEQMQSKWQDFDNFLNDLDIKYAEEVKEKGGIRNYVAYGTGNNDIKYAFDNKLPEYLQKEFQESQTIWQNVLVGEARNPLYWVLSTRFFYPKEKNTVLCDLHFEGHRFG